MSHMGECLGNSEIRGLTYPGRLLGAPAGITCKKLENENLLTVVDQFQSTSEYSDVQI